MSPTLKSRHILCPPADFSFEGDRINQSLGPNNPYAAVVMQPLLDIGMVHALITRRHGYQMKSMEVRDFHRFTLLLEGSMQISMNGTDYAVNTGELVYYSPGTTVFQRNPGNCWYLYLTFLDHPVWETLKARGPYVRAYESADLLYLLMEHISDAYEGRKALAMHLARHEAAMLAELMRHEIKLMVTKRNPYEADLQQIVEQIKKKPEADWTVATMAQKACVSPRTLNRLFLKEYGVTPIDLVVKERITRAYHMLTETDMKIDAITYAVGYTSVASFCRLFKRLVGKSPGLCRWDLTPS